MTVVVGQQPEVEGRPPCRPGPAHPAGHRSHRHGHRGRHAREPRRQVRRRRHGHPRHQRARRPEPHRRPGARDPRRAGAAHPRPAKPDRNPDHVGQRRQRRWRRQRRRPPTTAASSCGRSSVAATTSASTSTTATTRSTSPPTTARRSARRRAGTVIFAGWKNNGGGYQVWIAHGSNLYTTYNHMSAISVGVGQHVARGQQVGRIGKTGDATGPHFHFEVWRAASGTGGTGSTRWPTCRPRRAPVRALPGAVGRSRTRGALAHSLGRASLRTPRRRRPARAVRPTRLPALSRGRCPRARMALDVPRPREDLGPRRRWRRRGRDLPAGGARPARRSRRR